MDNRRSLSKLDPPVTRIVLLAINGLTIALLASCLGDKKLALKFFLKGLHQSRSLTFGEQKQTYHYFKELIEKNGN